MKDFTCPGCGAVIDYWLSQSRQRRAFTSRNDVEDEPVNVDNDLASNRARPYPSAYSDGQSEYFTFFKCISVRNRCDYIVG